MGYTKKLQSMQNLQKQQNNQQKFQISQNFDNPDCQLQLIQESFIVEKDFSLYVDAYGEVVLYKFHHPVIISGALKKCNSKPNPNLKNINYKWINVHNINYTIIGNFGFAINKNIALLALLINLVLLQILYVMKKNIFFFWFHNADQKLDGAKNNSNFKKFEQSEKKIY